MAHPSFQDRSFAQMARRALSRCSYDVSPSMREALLVRARLADARAHIGPHAGSSRGKDRRYAIHVRARSAVALVVAELAVA